MDETSPARLYCLLVGAVLVIAGIIGFFYEASFATGDSLRSDKVFDVLAVNGWHNLVHISIGAILLIAAGSAARPAAIGQRPSSDPGGHRRDRGGGQQAGRTARTRDVAAGPLVAAT